MKFKEYRICRSCIMDTSDPNIVFSPDGECDYCANFRRSILPIWSNDNSRLPLLMRQSEEIRASNKDHGYDCIIGLSGGLDSSFTAYVAKDIMGLRPLLLHVDAGWNTAQAVRNIQSIVNGLNLDLHTEVIDWSEMQDLQLAFLRSQIADQDLPQDAAFFSALYRFARKYKIRHILTGANYSTECCREPEEWGGFPGIDVKLFDDIYRRFGNGRLKSFPLVDVLSYRIGYRLFHGIKVHKPLNFVRYFKREAESLLFDKFGWMPFQHKHHESIFTRFYEDFWLPRKFGFQKRRAHFSSLIMTKQMTREQAIERIESSELSELLQKTEFKYVSSKLGVSEKELWNIFEGKNRSFREYENKLSIIKAGARLASFLGSERRLFR